MRPLGEVANPVKISAPPRPRKKTAIMPAVLQRSPSQPAGSEATPNNTKPGTASHCKSA